MDVLHAGVRDRTLDTIMFPSDPVANAPQIISRLSSVFPIAPDHHVFGPMARIGWGTPALLTIDIGLVFQLPSPVRLIILGRFRLALPPEEKKPVIRINLDVVGVLDFDRCEASIDATLYDSMLVTYTLTGDMAMRLSWGRTPMFALSAGGFNPHFQPPASFPTLQRLAISLATGNNPRLRLEAYLAVTSNTVQFGARLDLYASAGKFSIEGMLQFDALLEETQHGFGFIVDINGGVALRYSGRVLLGVAVELTLSGMHPLHAHGRATFRLWFSKASVELDVTSGTQEIPEPLIEPERTIMSCATLC